MEDLLKRLQLEAGLTEKQAVKAISVIKDQMEKGNFDIDWDKFMKGKYDDFLSKAKVAFSDAGDGVNKYTDILADKADDFADSAKAKLKDFGKKAADFFDGDDEKKA